MTIADSDRYLTFRHVIRRNVGPPVHAALMTASYDADLLDYVFWARNVKGLSDNTLRVRMDLVHRLHQFLDAPLRDAHPGQLLRFERVAIAGRSAQTRRAYASHIRAFYRWAKTTGIVTEDPSLILTMPIVPQSLPRPIEEDDLDMALSAARPKMAAMLTLAAFAGLRCCEIAGLDWSDFIREADGSTFLHIRNGKGGKSRRVEVGVRVIRVLQQYGPKRRGPMFLGLDGQQIRAKSVSRSINRYLEKNEISATAHQLRHRYASVAYQLSHDIRMVQEMLGHASPSTTAGYARPSADAARKMVAAMDALESTRSAALPPLSAGS